MDFPKHLILEDEKLPMKSKKPKSLRERGSHCAWKEEDRSHVDFAAAYVTPHRSGPRRQVGWDVMAAEDPLN